MKIKIFFAWYDFWIGFYYDRAKKTLYFCPLPMICISFKKLPPLKEQCKRIDTPYCLGCKNIQRRYSPGIKINCQTVGKRSHKSLAVVYCSCSNGLCLKKDNCLLHRDNEDSIQPETGIEFIKNDGVVIISELVCYDYKEKTNDR